MNSQQLRKLINQGIQDTYQLTLRRDNLIHLLTDSDIGSFYLLLKEKCSSVQQISLEDLTVSDTAASVLPAIIQHLPVKHFSLQGSHLGDSCIQKIVDALSCPKPNTNWLMDTHKVTSVGPASQLESLIISAPTATDHSLSLLETLLVNNRHLKKISIDWSQSFSLSQAWQLATAVAVYNLTLTTSGLHGFFHSISCDQPEAIAFINNLLEAAMHRNQHLTELTDPIKRYNHYTIFFQVYNKLIKQNLDFVQTEHGLMDIDKSDLEIQPLTLAAFTLHCNPPDFYRSLPATDTPEILTPLSTSPTPIRSISQTTKSFTFSNNSLPSLPNYNACIPTLPNTPDEQEQESILHGGSR